MDSLLQQEEQVDRYVSQNNREAAVKLLFELIVRYAKDRKDFAKAETLRQRLFEVDEMALTEIIKSAEIIEAARSESIDRDHVNIWTNLYSALTTEEANALYYAMREAAYDPDRAVFRQGDINSCLYFIDNGQLKLFYTQGDKEIFTDNVREGDIVGDDTFFSSTICTVSLTTLSSVKLHFLDNSILPKWRKDFPLLEPKLIDFCNKYKKVYDIQRRGNVERRTQNRIKLSGKTLVQLMGPTGVATGNAFKGELSDLSSGGLSFFVRISKRETARLLLGRKLNLKFALSTGQSHVEIDKVGTVVAVRAYPFDDHSVHVRFDNPLDRSILERVERCPNPISLLED